MFKFVKTRIHHPLKPFNAIKFASTLTLIEVTSEGKIAQSSLNTLAAAAQLGNPVNGLVLGSKASEIAESLKHIDYKLLNKVLVAESKIYDHYLPENVAPLCAELLKNQDYSHFLTSSSSIGKNVLPRIGALLDYQPICDIIQIQDHKTFIRPMYAGNVLATVECNQDKKLISIRASSFESLHEGTNNAVIEHISIPESKQLNIHWNSNNLTKSERPELTSASRVVSGGRGLKNKETFEKLIVPLADVLGAGIGATRAAVDSGFCDNDLQIGQTGKIIAPELYIAVGISGAIQHLAGIRESKTIVAINKDPEAPIFQFSDYGIVADANDIIPELIEKLK